MLRRLLGQQFILLSIVFRLLLFASVHCRNNQYIIRNNQYIITVCAIPVVNYSSLLDPSSHAREKVFRQLLLIPKGVMHGASESLQQLGLQQAFNSVVLLDLHAC